MIIAAVIMSHAATLRDATRRYATFRYAAIFFDYFIVAAAAATIRMVAAMPRYGFAMPCRHT